MAASYSALVVLAFMFYSSLAQDEFVFGISHYRNEECSGSPFYVYFHKASACDLRDWGYIKYGCVDGGIKYANCTEDCASCGAFNGVESGIDNCYGGGDYTSKYTCSTSTRLSMSLPEIANIEYNFVAGSYELGANTQGVCSELTYLELFNEPQCIPLGDSNSTTIYSACENGVLNRRIYNQAECSGTVVKSGEVALGACTYDETWSFDSVIYACKDKTDLGSAMSIIPQYLLSCALILTAYLYA